MICIHKLPSWDWESARKSAHGNTLMTGKRTFWLIRGLRRRFRSGLTSLLLSFPLSILGHDCSLNLCRCMSMRFALQQAEYSVLQTLRPAHNCYIAGTNLGVRVAPSQSVWN